jgi:hypothetical protein
MSDLLFDMAALSAADSLSGIERSNFANTQNERIRVLTELLKVVTDPQIRTQVESILRQELNDIDPVKLRRKRGWLNLW